MTAFQGQKLVHFDFKGAPPKIEYLLQIIPLLREWGATGILAEYEDMFPYKDDLQVVRKPYCYTLDDIHRLQQAAENENLTFIPLVQTFGHMEFVLKHAKFESLRETIDNPMSVCPLHKATQNLVKSLVDQIVEAHEDLKYLHIGGDEVGLSCHVNRCHAGIHTTIVLVEGLYNVLYIYIYIYIIYIQSIQKRLFSENYEY